MVSIRVFIVTHRRAALLDECLTSLLASDLVDQDYIIFIINNHSSFSLAVEYKDHARIKVIHNMTRHDRSTGHLAQDWNTALIHGFVNLKDPACDIVCTIQDDSKVKADWCSNVLSVVPSRFDFLTAGAGDQLCVYTAQAVQKIGLWDERFSGLQCQEADYFLRARRILKERASITDPHHKRLYNALDITLLQYVLPGSERGCVDYQASLAHHRRQEDLYFAKWALNTTAWLNGMDDGVFNPDGTFQHITLYPYFID